MHWWRHPVAAARANPYVAVSIAVALACAVAAVLVLVQTPYQLQMPGPVTEVQRLIEPNPHPGKGALYLTTIYSEPANLAEWLYAKVSPDAELIPREQARPRNVSEKEYQKLLTSMMDESKLAAKVVGLRAAGYEVKLIGHGVQINDVIEASKARDVLKQGDVIIEADGQSVMTANDLIALIQAHRPGEVLKVRVQRGEETLSLEFPLIAAPDEPGRARAGISVQTYKLEFEFPTTLQLETRDIGGPSAGLMFALGVYNAVTEEDITRGHKIAGTGMISTEGKVGPVGGVKYKVAAAERARAEVFLVSRQNYEEAQKHARSIRVVPVGTFEEALQALRDLPPV